MSFSLSSNYRKCVEIDQTVRVDQSEGECRSQHGCEQTFCPLTTEFSPDKLDFLLALTGKSSR